MINKNISRYSTTTNEWTQVPMLQTSRCYNGSVSLKKNIYVVGGWAKGEGRLSSVERFDPLKNTWQFVASLNYGRTEMGCCVINGYIFVAGGSNLSSIEKYDEKIDRWSIVSFTN